jgi:hypothetical protein
VLPELGPQDALDSLYEDAIRAFLPANPSFDFERSLAGLQSKRDVAFLLGLLSDGENEAALCLELAHAKRAASPASDVTHILEEGWYYLRTSIDLGWQLEPGPAPDRAMVAYLEAMLRGRIERLAQEPRLAPAADEPAALRARLLRRLWGELR